MSGEGGRSGEIAAEYGVLISSASTAVYPDLVGTIYPTMVGAIMAAGQIADAQPGIETVLVQRPDPAHPWRLFGQETTAAQWLALRNHEADK